MKRFIIGLLLVSLCAWAHADSKVSDLALVTDAAGDDLFYIVDGGTADGQITWQRLGKMSLDIISADVNAISGTVVSLSDDLITTNTNIAIISADIGGSDMIRILSSDVARHADETAVSLDIISSDVGTISGTIVSISHDINEYTGALAIVSDDVNLISGTVVNISGDMSIIKEYIVIISDDVGLISDTVVNISYDIIGIQEDLIIISDDVNTLSQTVVSISHDIVASDMILILSSDISAISNTVVIMSDDISLISGTVVNISADIAESKQYIIASARIIEMWNLDKSNGVPIFTNTTPWTLTIESISADAVSDDTQIQLKRSHWTDYSLSHDIISVDISQDGVGSGVIGTQIYYVGIAGSEITPNLTPNVRVLSPDDVILAEFNTDDSRGEPDYVGITIRMSR